MVNTKSLTRNVHAYVAYEQDGVWVDISSSISKMTINEIACSGSVLKMGEFCKNSIKFEYYSSKVDGAIAWNNKRIRVGLEYSSLYPDTVLYPSTNVILNKPQVFGIFYVDGTSVTTNNNGITYKVTGYDMPAVMSEVFDTTKTGTNVMDILAYIEKLSGLTIANKSLISLQTVTTVPEQTTNAGMIAYIAGYDGYNARMNVDGNIELYWYYSTSDSDNNLYTITRQEQYLNNFSNSSDIPTLNAITSGKGTPTTSTGTSNPVYTAGSGEALTFQNPYITQEQVDKIYNRVKGFKYSVGTIKWRGDQTVRAGDTVRVETTKGEYVYLPVMETTLTFDGGMSCKTTSHTYVVKSTVMGKTPQEKRVQTIYSDLTKVFQQQTGIIQNNLKGGYYRLLQDEETKYPYGWQVANSETITPQTKGWQWTQGGLMHSSDGFQTADKVAFTEDGYLAAEMIAANTIQIGQLHDDVLETVNGNISDTKDKILEDVNTNISDTKDKILEDVNTNISDTKDKILEDVNNNIANTKNEVTESYTTLIKNTSEQITEVVSKLTATSDENNKSIVNINNSLNITAEDINLVKSTTAYLQNVVDGKVSTAEIKEWARFDGATLELGASNQPFKARLTTTELAFYQGGNKVAWISNNELHILTAIITQSIGCGNFMFVDEGSLGFSLI